MPRRSGSLWSTTAREAVDVVIPAKRSAERESSRRLCTLEVVAGFPLTRFALAGMTSVRRRHDGGLTAPGLIPGPKTSVILRSPRLNEGRHREASRLVRGGGRNEGPAAAGTQCIRGGWVTRRSRSLEPRGGAGRRCQTAPGLPEPGMCAQLPLFSQTLEAEACGAACIGEVVSSEVVSWRACRVERAQVYHRKFQPTSTSPPHRRLVIPASAERASGKPEANSNGGEWGWIPALRCAWRE
jgi:hypothetical protein